MRIFYFCLSLLLLHSVFGLTYKVHEIFDLEYTSSDFAQEATYWNSSGLLSSGLTQYCDGYPLLGGYGATGPNTIFSRNYTNLPSHSLAVFIVKFWLFGNWKSSDYITVSITSPQVNYKKAILKIKYDKNLWENNICGVNGLYGYKYAKLLIGTPNLGSSVKIEFQASQSSNYIYFGIRNLKITFLNYQSNILDYCLVTYPSSLTLDSPCWFNDAFYQSNNNYYQCDSSCSICASGSSSGCLSCKDNYINNGLQCVQCNSACQNCYGLGSNQCTSCKSGSFLYSSNSTCMSQCVAPYVQKSKNGVNYCNPPCDDTSKYAYTNGSCLSTCPAPFIQKSYEGGAFKTCSFPCSTYLFSNGSCIDSCNAPLQVVYQGGYKFCNYQCSALQYLYINGSCLGACDQPLQAIMDVNNNKFCLNSCSNKYLYWNGSCLGDCPSPFIQKIQSGSKFCHFPCDNGEFLWNNNSCISSCNYPLIQRQGGVSGEHYCDLPCPSLSEYFYDNSTCSINCNSPFIATTEPSSSVNLCQSPCTSNKYLYPDGSCLSTPCDTPYMTKTQDGINFCVFKCPITSQYLYSNDSCSSQCSLPFSVRNETGGMLFCDPICASAEYWYANNSSCQDSCQSPFVIRRESGINYCDFPCTSDQYFSQAKEVCIDSCPQPFIIKDKYCENPCNDSSPYYYPPDQTCRSTCIDPYYPIYQDGYFTCGAKNSIVNLNEARSATMKAASAGLIASTIISGGSPGAVTIAIFAKMFEYINPFQVGGIIIISLLILSFKLPYLYGFIQSE